MKIETPLGVPAPATVSCILGTWVLDITGNLKLLAGNRIVVNVRANDILLRQSEVTKNNKKKYVQLRQCLVPLFALSSSKCSSVQRPEMFFELLGGKNGALKTKCVLLTTGPYSLAA